MAEDLPTITSAIIVPESLEAAPAPRSPQNSLKRRNSSTSQDTVKRPRVSTDGENGHGSKDSPVEDDSRAARRKSGQVEERRRGQRLFGALLGTLSQSSTTSTKAQERANMRADVERRQQAKLRQQSEEVSQRQLDRLQELNASRRKEQKILDEQTIRQRHNNLRQQAHFLQTTTEPRLMYKPWDPLPEQEEQIRRQIEDSEATITREIEHFERKRAEEDASATRTNTKAASTDDQKSGDQDINMVGSEKSPEATNSETKHQNGDTNMTSPIKDPAEAEKVDTGPEEVATEEEKQTAGAEEEQDTPVEETNDDEVGETVVEAAEDTIIY